MVGLFVLLCGLGLAALLIFAAAGDRLWASKKTYVVVYPDGVGLTPGLNVTIAGLVVGEVTTVQLTPDRKVAVSLYVDAAYADFVHTDSVVQARMTLGGKQVDIGPGVGPVLEDGGTLLAGENMDPFVVIDAAETLAQLAEALSELRGLSDAFGLGEGEIPAAIGDLAFILKQLREGEGLIGQAIQDPSMSREALATLGDVKQASQSLVLASQAIQEAGSAISSASTDLSTGSVAVGAGAEAIESGMPAIQAGAESIDTAMVEINRTLKELNRSLTRMQQVMEQLPGARVLGKDPKAPKEKAPAPNP
ncbi:MAG: ABC-type transporter Mla subunit MlaD [Cognaticolwellia sp.]|jgi:ABC-type transporter Mla subunit MlaD